MIRIDECFDNCFENNIFESEILFNQKNDIKVANKNGNNQFGISFNNYQDSNQNSNLYGDNSNMDYDTLKFGLRETLKNSLFSNRKEKQLFEDTNNKNHFNFFCLDNHLKDENSPDRKKNCEIFQKEKKKKYENDESLICDLLKINLITKKNNFPRNKLTKLINGFTDKDIINSNPPYHNFEEVKKKSSEKISINDEKILGNKTIRENFKGKNDFLYNNFLNKIKIREKNENTQICEFGNIPKESCIEKNSKKILKNKKFNTGRWSDREHRRFIEAIIKYGNKWKKIQQKINTRSSSQARSHAQKFFLRIKKEFKINQNISFESFILFNKFQNNLINENIKFSENNSSYHGQKSNIAMKREDDENFEEIFFSNFQNKNEIKENFDENDVFNKINFQNDEKNEENSKLKITFIDDLSEDETKNKIRYNADLEEMNEKKVQIKELFLNYLFNLNNNEINKNSNFTEEMKNFILKEFIIINHNPVITRPRMKKTHKKKLNYNNFTENFDEESEINDKDLKIDSDILFKNKEISYHDKTCKNEFMSKSNKFFNSNDNPHEKISFLISNKNDYILKDNDSIKNSNKKINYSLISTTKGNLINSKFICKNDDKNNQNQKTIIKKIFCIKKNSDSKKEDLLNTKSDNCLFERKNIFKSNNKEKEEKNLIHVNNLNNKKTNFDINENKVSESVSIEDDFLNQKLKFENSYSMLSETSKYSCSTICSPYQISLLENSNQEESKKLSDNLYLIPNSSNNVNMININQLKKSHPSHINLDVNPFRENFGKKIEFNYQDDYKFSYRGKFNFYKTDNHEPILKNELSFKENSSINRDRIRKKDVNSQSADIFYNDYNSNEVISCENFDLNNEKKSNYNEYVQICENKKIDITRKTSLYDELKFFFGRDEKEDFQSNKQDEVKNFKSNEVEFRKKNINGDNNKPKKYRPIFILTNTKKNNENKENITNYNNEPRKTSSLSCEEKSINKLNKLPIPPMNYEEVYEINKFFSDRKSSLNISFYDHQFQIGNIKYHEEIICKDINLREHSSKKDANIEENFSNPFSLQFDINTTEENSSSQIKKNFVNDNCEYVYFGYEILD